MRIEELLNRPHVPESHDGVPAWMATFADLCILLLTFFVVMLSFATLDAQKFRQVLGSVRDAFGVASDTRPASGAPPGIGGNPARSTVPAPVPVALPMERAPAVIRAAFDDLGEPLQLLSDGRSVTVRVDGRLLFPSGSADLNPGARSLLDRVLALMRAYTFELHILGHTDSLPIETARFPSNWELSAARASAALRYLAAQGVDPGRLVAVGFADSRPLAREDTAEGRARNRRVEFVFRMPDPRPASAASLPSPPAVAD